MYKPEIYIEGERLDLFEGENISVVSSVQKIEDISRNFNDYSQSFTVPASPNNNRIFKHWYNFSITNGFDSRVRHDAKIDIQTVPFKEGGIRLESCKIESNKPVHYKITFLGLLVNLKALIGDDYLSALDLSKYDIDYTSNNIKLGVTSGLYDGEYIFPLISTQRQWFYNSDTGSTVYEEKLGNIAWNGSAIDHGLEWTSLRPALLVNKIIESIETDYGIKFSRDFLFSEPFDNLYLWMANQDSTESLKSKYRIIDYDNVNVYQPAIGSFTNSTGAYTPTERGSGFLRSVEFRFHSSDNVLYTVQLMNGDNVLSEDSGTGDIAIDYSSGSGVEKGSSIYFRVVTSSQKLIDRMNFRIRELSEDTVLFVEKFTISIDGSTALTSEFVPKIKVLDFLKGIIKKYNLVVVPISKTEFYVNTLDAWYDEGNIYDITKYVSTEESTIARSKIFKEITFKFQEPETILADNFNTTNNTAYGDLETKLKNADGTALDGETFDIEVAFEQMVYEKLFDLNNDSPTNIVYGLSLDKGRDEAVPAAHLFYARKVNTSANPISIVDETGTKSQLNGNVFMPSHSESTEHKYSTNFGGETDEHTGSIINNSLFKLYYEDYIKDSFSIRRRKVSYTAKLPLWMLGILKLNDRLVVGTDRYLINESTVNVTDQTAKLELLNDIYGESDLNVEEETPNNPTEPNNPPPEANSFTVSNTGGSTTSLGCEKIPNTTRYWNGSGASPNFGDVIYTDLLMKNIFNGQNKYFKIADEKVIRISTNGIVQDIFFCSQTVGGGANQ